MVFLKFRGAQTPRGGGLAGHLKLGVVYPRSFGGQEHPGGHQKRGGQLEQVQQRQGFDRQLKQINIEYKAKRDSRRLGNPVLYLMREGWYERARKKQVEGGMRAFQAKTQLLAPSKEETVRILPESKP